MQMQAYKYINMHMHAPTYIYPYILKTLLGTNPTEV